MKLLTGISILHFYIEPEHRRGRETLLRKAIDEANRRDLRDRQRRNSMD